MEYTKQMMPPSTSLPPGMTSPPALLYLPIFHMMGMFVLLLSLQGQGSFLLLPRFLPEPFLKAIQDFKIMNLSVVPPIASFLLKSPLVNKYDTSSLKTVACGGAPLKKETAQALQKRFLLFKVSQGYGLTELTTGATFAIPGTKDGSAGAALPGTEILIVDQDTKDKMGPGDVGEIWVRGPQVMKGYFGKPEATAETVDPEGWLHTGDVGYIDEDGFVFVVDRLKELIKYKAYQVAPAELEAVLLGHPGIDDVGVVGVPDEDGTNELPLALVVKSDPDLAEEEVHRYVEERVAPYKKLRGGVKFIDQVPRTASGKIIRRKLKALL